MKIEFDPVKNQRNIRERDLSFEKVHDLDWDETVLTFEDTRSEYPERRFVSMATLNGRLHVVCFTPIPGGIRVISFRKANKREVKLYEEKTLDR
jgi:uncharacterized DUF497 family protein